LITDKEFETAGGGCLQTPEVKAADKSRAGITPYYSQQVKFCFARRTVDTEGEKMQPEPFAKLITLAVCVSVLAALFLAVLPDFRPDVVHFQARVAMFTARYTMPICFFQLVVFSILYHIRKR